MEEDVMNVILKVVDQSTARSVSDRRAGVTLRLASQRVSARDIIRSRVMAEIQAINRAKQNSSEARGDCSYLVRAEAEEQLNRASSKAWSWATPEDMEAEVDRALTAFARRRFVMLLDDRQIEDIDELVGLRPESEVVFIHLTPLKGG
jgi:hypothetical protein